jgi:hypothetical protein
LYGEETDFLINNKTLDKDDDYLNDEFHIESDDIKQLIGDSPEKKLDNNLFSNKYSSTQPSKEVKADIIDDIDDLVEEELRNNTFNFSN